MGGGEFILINYAWTSDLHVSSEMKAMRCRKVCVGAISPMSLTKMKVNIG